MERKSWRFPNAWKMRVASLETKYLFAPGAWSAWSRQSFDFEMVPVLENHTNHSIEHPASNMFFWNFPRPQLWIMKWNHPHISWNCPTSHPLEQKSNITYAKSEFQPFGHLKKPSQCSFQQNNPQHNFCSQKKKHEEFFHLTTSMASPFLGPVKPFSWKMLPSSPSKLLVFNCMGWKTCSQIKMLFNPYYIHNINGW